MFSKELEEIIEAALADGVLTDKERAVLHKRAQAEGIDPDELDVVIEGRLAKMKKSEDWLRPTPPQHLANEKQGNVVKCPNCGAPVVGGSAVCSECGYAFTNVSANRSYALLAEKLEKIDAIYRDKVSLTVPLYGVSKKTKEKAEVIRNFPVPNTRADLLEFLTSLHAKKDDMSGGGMQVFEGQTLQRAYEAKYKECVNKARINFSDDPDFAPYLKPKFFEKYKKTLIGIGILTVFILLYGGIGLGFFINNNKEKENVEKIEAFISNQNFESAASLLPKVEVGSYEKENDNLYLAVVKGFIGKGDNDSAIEVALGFRTRVGEERWKTSSVYNYLIMKKLIEPEETAESPSETNSESEDNVSDDVSQTADDVKSAAEEAIEESQEKYEQAMKELGY